MQQRSDLARAERELEGPTPHSCHVRQIREGYPAGVKEEERQQALRTIAVYDGCAAEAAELRKQAEAKGAEAERLINEARELAGRASILESHAIGVSSARGQLADERNWPREAREQRKTIAAEMREIAPERQRLRAELTRLEAKAAPPKEPRPQSGVNGSPYSASELSGHKGSWEHERSRKARLANEAMTRKSAERQIPAMRERLAALDARSAELEAANEAIRAEVMASYEREIEQLRADAGDAADPDVKPAKRGRAAAVAA